MNHDLTIDYVLPPLVCSFAGTQPAWQAETRRCLQELRSNSPEPHRPTAEIHWQSCPLSPAIAPPVPPGSFVALAVQSEQLEASASVICSLYQKNVVVAVIGAGDLTRHRIALTAAGAVALVTDVFGCGRLAAIINRMCLSQQAVITDWQTRFVNRLPWTPVRPNISQ